MSDSAPKTPAPNEGPSRIPAKIGRYDVVERLGSGRSGTVYRATDPFIGRVLAIKIFRVDVPPGPERDRFLQRFYHEARISGGLSHPNIVALFDVGEVEGLPYLVFEHVEGPTLDVTLARAGRLDSNETIRVVEQMASALDLAHSRGIVHRDVRPANIILATDRRVRIADFGIARIEGSQLTQLGEILGTPAYMSPEQIRGQELSASSDLFSLAVCAYEMLSGQRPFSGKTQAELLEALVYSPPVEPKELRALGIPSRDFMFVFERALAKDPSHRFADGAAFARALKSCLGVVAPGDAPPPVTRIAIPDPMPVMKRAILPPVAPPVSHVDTAATAAIDSEFAGPTVSSADATFISDVPSEEALVSTVGFEQGLTARKQVTSSDATMVAPDQDSEMPPTQRLSRQAVEDLLSKSAPSQAATGAGSPPVGPAFQKTLPGSEKAPASSSAGTSEGSLPPTREMPRLPSPSPSAGRSLSSSAPSTTLHDASHTSSQASSRAATAEKTIIMTEAEKAVAAKMRDRSVGKIQSGPAISRPAFTPPPSAPKPPVSKPVTLPPAASLPPGASPRPSMVPRIFLAGMGFLTLLALVLGVMFLGKAGRSNQQVSEKWNELPVYPEADVEKSPLIVSQSDFSKAKIEPEKVVSVTVSWIVTPEGLVDDPKIETSASPEIDAFVMEAVRKWRYEPGQKDGKTVPVRVRRKYTFGQRSSSEGS